MKKHTLSEKVLSLFLVVSILISLLPFDNIFAVWTTPNNITINDSTGSAEISYFINLYGTPQDANMYYVAGHPEDIAYCIDAEAEGPGGTAYAINDSSIDATFRNGLARIAQYGYPTNSWGAWGISASEAQYATQAAMHWWENTVFGGTEGWVRSGVQNNGCPTNYLGTLEFADWLLSLAGSRTSPLLYSKITSLPTAWSNAATPTSTFNVGIYDSDYWILTLPAGVTIAGSNIFTDTENASITVYLTDPVAFALSTKHISIQGYSNRTDEQIHYYVAGGGFQNMIIYQQSVSAAGDPSGADLPDATGGLSIHKVTSLQSSGAHVPEAGAIFQVYSVSPPALVIVLTTDAAGNAAASDLPAGQYNLHQAYAPPGTILAPDQLVSVTGGTVAYGNFVNNSTYFPITKRDAGSGIPVAGATITISQSGVPIVSEVTGADGSAWFESLPEGQYSWQESAAPAGYVRDTNTYSITLNADGSVSGTAAFTDIKSNGYIEAYKTTDRLGLAALEPGAVFQIYLTSAGSYAAAPAEVRDQITTDVNGHAISKLLPYGNYTFQQTVAPVGTVMDPIVRTLDVGTNGAGTMVDTDTDTVNISNTATVGRLEIVKTTDRGYSAPEAGAIFQIYNAAYASYTAAPETERDILTADAAGYDVSNWLPYGTYTIHQTFAPDGTKVMADSSVTLGSTDNETIHRDLVNQTYWGGIQILKYKTAPSDTSGILTPEPGATFRIFPSEYITYAAAITALSPAQEQVLTVEFTSGIAGVAATNHKLPYGIYTVEQIDTEANRLTFKVDAWPVTIGAVDDQTYTYIRNNEIYEQYLSIVKRDAETGQIIRMAGVTFEILAADGFTSLSDKNGDASFLTDTDGRIDIKDLALQAGDYYIRETKAPTGYTINTELKAFSVSISDHGSSIVTIDYGVDFREVPFVDTAQTCRLIVEKQGDVLTSAMLIDAINADSGERYSDEDGNALSIYKFGYSLTGKAGAVFEVFVGTADIVDHEGIVKKFDKDSDGVKETSLIAGTSLGMITTAAVLQKDSATRYIASLDGLPLDALTGTAQYIVREVTAPTGDLINPDPLTFDFSFADQTIAQIDQEQSITDTRQKVLLTVEKQKEAAVWNKTTGSFDWPLAAAPEIIFGLYTANGIPAQDGSVVVAADTLVDILYTDAAGIGKTTQDLPMGSYYAREISVTPDVVYDGTMTYPVTASPTADQNIAIAVIAINDGDAVINRTITGTMEVLKKTADTDLPMEGVVFEVYDNPGNLVDTITTGSDGQARTIVLPYGTYYLIETRTSTGYALAGRTNFSIYLPPAADMAVSEDNMTLLNYLIPATPTPTPTPTPVPTGILGEYRESVSKTGEQGGNKTASGVLLLLLLLTVSFVLIRRRHLEEK
ncbi:MAG: SpaA isopeptide-forming pilin-related protein [Eubacteriales bacterium]